MMCGYEFVLSVQGMTQVGSYRENLSMLPASVDLSVGWMYHNAEGRGIAYRCGMF